MLLALATHRQSTRREKIMQDPIDSATLQKRVFDFILDPKNCKKASQITRNLFLGGRHTENYLNFDFVVAVTNREDLHSSIQALPHYQMPMTLSEGYSRGYITAADMRKDEFLSIKKARR